MGWRRCRRAGSLASAASSAPPRPRTAGAVEGRRSTTSSRWSRSLVALAVALAPGVVSGCPGDAEPRAADTLLVLQGQAAPRALRAADLAALPSTTLQQELSVRNPAASEAASPRSVRYEGVLLRDLLLQAGFGTPQDRGARQAWVEAVATDGYRALFSWGELFNTPLGEQVLVIRTQDGRPLDAAAGPLALRSLGDLRPGPRHVRNLCALTLRR